MLFRSGIARSGSNSGLTPHELSHWACALLHSPKRARALLHKTGSRPFALTAKRVRAKPNRAIRVTMRRSAWLCRGPRCGDRGLAPDKTDFRSQRQRLSFLRRGVTPSPTSLESAKRRRLSIAYTRTRQAVPTGEAHRLSKVGGMYRRNRFKSSAYGHKSAMPQAHLRRRQPQRPAVSRVGDPCHE